MSFIVSRALFKWKECLTLCNQQEQRDTFSSVVTRIYDECIALQHVESVVLDSKPNISLNTEFLKFRKKVNSLFLRTLINENNFKVSDEYENHEFKTKVLRVAEFLYKGNNTRAELILSEFPESLRRQIFLNLWRLLGRPTDRDDIGEQALFNRMGWNTSPSEKVQAIASCFNISFAIHICAHIGDIETLQMILSEHSPDHKEVDLTEVLISVCRSGHTSSLALILANRVSSMQLSHGLTSAVEHGQIDCVNIILRKKEGKADLLECMQIAVRNNFIDIFALLLNHSHRDKEILSDILSFVSKEGCIDFLHVILSDGYQNSLDKQSLLAAIRECSMNGYIHVLEKLFAVEVVDNQINGLDLLPLIYATAKHGHSDCLQFLISKVSLNGVTLTFLDQAIVIAIENRHLSALHVLLEGRVQPIRHQELMLSLKSICNNRSLDCLEILLQHDRLINDKDFAQFVISVIKYGQYDSLMVILASNCKKKIDSDKFNIFLGTSVDIQDVECFKLLLADGRDKQVTTNCIECMFYRISFLGNLPLLQICFEYNFDQSLGELTLADCLYNTALFNHVECLKVLLTHIKDTQISQENLGLAFRTAAKLGSADCLQVFFDQNLHAKIPAIEFGVVMTQVVDNNDIENLRLFFEKDRYQLIPEYDLCEAIRISSINNRIDILELLHGNDRYKQFLPERLDESMRSAIDHGHTEVVYFLLLTQNRNVLVFSK